MSYVPVESDDRTEEAPLQFDSFPDGGVAREQTQPRGAGNVERGYLQDQLYPNKSNSGFWTVEYYQPYFDVDTTTVLKRCYATLLPTSTNYFSTHLNPADLYGPFWTLTTLIFALYLSSSLAASISAYLSSPGDEYDYDFKLLSLAVSIVYVYGIALPILLWLSLRYLGVGEWSVVDAIAIWGYSLFSWIPVSILCVLPFHLLRWILVFIAFAQTGYFLVRNIYPILASAEAKATRLLIIIIAVLHAALALSFKVLFFDYYVVAADSGDPIPIPGESTPSADA